MKFGNNCLWLVAIIAVWLPMAGAAQDFGKVTEEDDLKGQIGMGAGEPIFETVMADVGILELINIGKKDSDFCRYPCVVVVDVVDVTLVSIGGFDMRYRFDNASLNEYPYAYYRVCVAIRDVEKGVVKSRYLSFPVKCARRMFMHNGGWFFYRGITLKLGLDKIFDRYCVREVYPALPYEPYTCDVVKIEGGTFDRGPYYNWSLSAQLSPLTIEYDKHTKVRYRVGKGIGVNEFCSFADFGTTAQTEVEILNCDANLEFWQDAWFEPKIVKLGECVGGDPRAMRDKTKADAARRSPARGTSRVKFNDGVDVDVGINNRRGDR